MIQQNENDGAELDDPIIVLPLICWKKIIATKMKANLQNTTMSEQGYF